MKMKIIRIPPLLTWHVCQIVVDCLSPIVIACVFKPIYGTLVVK